MISKQITNQLKKNKRQTKKAYILEKYVSSKVSKGIYLFF